MPLTSKAASRLLPYFGRASLEASDSKVVGMMGCLDKRSILERHAPVVTQGFACVYSDGYPVRK